MKKSVLFALMLFLPTASVQAKPAEMSAETKATYSDIEKAFGFVPTFLKAFPEDAIVGAWSQMKALSLSPKTAIPGKYKELLGLAVAAQIPCQFCVIFHTEAAKLNGATDREIKEAVATSALARHWSTFFNGVRLDESMFMKEVDSIMKYLQTPAAQDPALANMSMNDHASTLKYIEKSLGTVPQFVKLYPKEALPGAWRTIRDVEFNPNGAIPGKYKSLIGLAVAAQIPCRFCVYFDTEGAKLSGATQDEIAEAVALAGLTRQWSTVLNGSQVDLATFKKETKQIVDRAKKEMSKAGKMAGVN